MTATQAAFRGALAEFDTTINGFVSGVNGVISIVPDWAKDLLSEVFERWKEFLAKLKKFERIVADVLSYGTGDPGALRAAAKTLQAEVVDALNSLRDSFDDSPIKAAHSWQGLAGTAYYDRYVKQMDAPKKLEPSATAATSALNDLANGLDTFWSNLTAGLISAGLSIVGLALSLATIIGAIVAIVSLLVSLYFLFKNEWDDLTRITDRGKVALEDAVKAAQVFWPRAVATA